MKVINVEDLSADDIRKLQILEDSIVHNIVKSRLRGLNDALPEKDVISSWLRIVEKAKKRLNIGLPIYTDSRKIRASIATMILKEFPHQKQND